MTILYTGCYHFINETMKKILSLLMLLSLIIGLANCGKRTSLEPSYLSYDYYPYDTLSWWIYEVDSTAWVTLNSTTDTFHFNYQIKEEYTNTFTDNANRKGILLQRSIRANQNESWRLKDIWKVYKNSMRVEKIEENVNFIKLVFPARQGKKWDGNAYNTMDEQLYTITELHKAYSGNGITFDSTLTVVQEDFVSLINEDIAMEVFAKDVGMIYKSYRSITKEFGNAVKDGIDYTYQLVSHGH